MSQQKLLAVLLKFLGFLCLFKTLEFAGYWLSYCLLALLGSMESIGWRDMILVHAPAVLWVAAFLILLKWGNAIARGVFPTEEGERSSELVPGDPWYVFALTMAGVALLVFYVPHSILVVLQTFFMEPERAPYSELWPAVSRLVLETGIALTLILGASGLTGLLKKIRSTPYPHMKRPPVPGPEDGGE